ncbi:MAG: carboxypeptidase regulatory-like domain-containing protein [Acidobacteriia bacterium]|nr:carboxypeptidase regulatory-like domain-containing protein [Terriglobia bacterium]
MLKKRFRLTVWGVVEGMMALMILMAWISLSPAQSQITTGVVQGTVMDPSGAVVPGTNVEAKNLDTNLTKTVTTGNDGRFVFLLLPSGRYTITATKAGFATLIQENVNLTVGQTITLDMAMKVSQQQERVTVTATPTIETTETVSATTLNELSVEKTPVLGRKFEDLLTLTPGVSIVQGPDGDEINFNGQRGIFNNISLDGGDYNNGFFGEQMGGQRASIDITLDAVKEFQVVAAGANAEFGRTAGGVVNVVTKSGTNNFHGSLFHFQRLEALTADTSDGKGLDGFKREQFGGTVGGPIIKDKMFFFTAFEQIFEDLNRANLSQQIGATPCAVATPLVGTNDAQINANADCQRLALVNFFKTKFNQIENLPVAHPIRNSSLLGRFDYIINPANQLSVSYNFDYSKNTNQTFDVPTYGNSANGIEGPSKIQTISGNLITTISQTMLNEFHAGYSRENRPRGAVLPNGVPDTAMGFATTFRFGQPFFLEPTIDELFYRTDIRDNFSIISGKHNIKFGGEWLHSRNVQVFRGFFNGRYIFDSVTGFLHYASPASLGPGYGPTAMECSNGAFVDITGTCPAGSTPTGGPLLLYLQNASPSGPTTDAAGKADMANENYALFIQDKWQIRPNVTLNYGLRWEAQMLAQPVIPGSKTAYGVNLSNPRFPSDGTLPNQKKMFQPRVGIAWDIAGNSKSVLRASFGIYNGNQNMLTQVGPITTNGVQLEGIVAVTGFNSAGGNPPTYPNKVVAPVLPPGTFPFQPGVTVFSKDYANPRIYTANFAFEQELMENLAGYANFTWSKGVHLTRFINPNVGPVVTIPANGDTVSYSGPIPFPNLGAITDTVSSAKSLYRGITFGLRKRFSQHYQMDANYTYSRDYDDDSNERDPFTFRYANVFNLAAEYAPSDRDERHKVNFSMYGELPWGFQGDARIQAHSAQPITPEPRFLNGVDRGRNSLRKDNAFFTLDWRLARPFKFKERYALTPIVEMFNTFNNTNNINPLITPGLFNFDGFLRQGVGDPLQLQLAVKFTF